MERKTERIEVPYIDEQGNNKNAIFNISFISRGIEKSYYECNDILIKVTKLFNELSDLNTNISAAFEREEKKEVIQVLQEQKKALEARMLSFGELDFFKKRFELIEKILVQNGYKDSEFCNFDFWENNVEPKQLINFLDTAVFKDVDIESKKKVLKN